MIHYEICPYCGQGAVRKVKIKKNKKKIFFCEECDTIWENEVNDKTGLIFRLYAEKEGLEYSGDELEWEEW